MRRSVLTAGILFCSFLGGAAAQMLPNSAGWVAHAATTWLSLIASVSGPETGMSCLNYNCFPINQINVQSDRIIASPSTSAVEALGVIHSFGGGSAQGDFTGIGAHLSQTATTGNTSGNYVGMLSVATASAPDGANPAIWGGNDNTFLTGAATNWLQIIGREIDVAVTSGASVQDKIGLQTVMTSIDAVAGTRSNIGATFNNGAGATGWDCMVCAGGYAGNFPMNANGTIIGAWAHGIARNASGGAVPSNNAGTTLYGLDWSNVTFASGGAPIVMPLITPSSSSASCKAGATEWDASYVYICTAANTWKRATLASF